MEIGQCTCLQGRDGSPCSHQAAIILNFGAPSVNCIPTLDPVGKRKLAYIAYGANAIKDLSFYCTVSQPSKEEPVACIEDGNPNPDFSASCWAHIRAGAASDSEQQNGSDAQNQLHVRESDNYQKLCDEIDTIADDIKRRLKGDSIFQQAIEKFALTYRNLSSKPSNAHLISACHRFGWCFGGTVTRMQSGILRRGRRIPIQAKSAGRRKSLTKRGKAVTAPGRTVKSAFKKHPDWLTNNSLPIKPHNDSIKRPHLLKCNITKGLQNAGKW